MAFCPFHRDTAGPSPELISAGPLLWQRPRPSSSRPPVRPPSPSSVAPNYLSRSASKEPLPRSHSSRSFSGIAFDPNGIGGHVPGGGDPVRYRHSIVRPAVQSFFHSKDLNLLQFQLILRGSKKGSVLCYHDHSLACFLKETWNSTCPL